MSTQKFARRRTKVFGSAAITFSIALLGPMQVLGQDATSSNRSILVDDTGKTAERSTPKSQPIVEPELPRVVEELPAPEHSTPVRSTPSERARPSEIATPERQLGSNKSLQALADASLRLNEALGQLSTGEGWKRHLAMPAELFDLEPAETVTAESLSSVYVRFEQVNRDPEYRMIAELPAFRETQYRLAAQLGIPQSAPLTERPPRGGVYFGRNAAVQFGGGQGARFGGPNGVQFGGGQGARLGPNVQFGGGQGVRIGRFYIGR